MSWATEEERKMYPSRSMARQGPFDGGFDAPAVRLSTDDGLSFLERLAGETDEHRRHGIRA
jgi:hypothetical protein